MKNRRSWEVGIACAAITAILLFLALCVVPRLHP
jgi:hypothetical protein